MPGGLLHGNDKPCADSDIINLLLQGDVRCGTLECALGDEPNYDKDKLADRGNVIYAKDDDIKRLKELHVEIVSLANNHFFDLGKAGAEHTIELLDKEGIMHCGAGKDLKEAGNPVIVRVKGKSVAFLAFCDTNYNNVFYCTYATLSTPGVNPMKEEYVVSEIRDCASKYDYVVVLAHWGAEHTFYPNTSTVRMAEIMVKAGASLVLGSHPHRVQPVINTRRGSVAFSMGNFLFPERLIVPPKATWYPDREIDYSNLPITNEYPIVDRVTLKTLPYLARIGQIVEAQLEDGKIVTHYNYSYLNINNSLSLLGAERSQEIDRRIGFISRMLKYRYYRMFILVRKVLLTVRSGFSRL